MIPGLTLIAARWLLIISGAVVPFLVSFSSLVGLLPPAGCPGLVVWSGPDDVLTASGRRLASVAVQSGDLIELRRSPAVQPSVGHEQMVVGRL